MLKIAVYNQKGEQIGDQKLNEAIFGIKINPAVVHQAVIAQLANVRKVLAHTKTRGEVRGGGKKPWRQKGTGRARHGSIRSPIWIGGGVTFGPRKERNYKLKINKKVKQKSIFMALSDKVANSKFILLDVLELPAAKTKEMAKLIVVLKKEIIDKAKKIEIKQEKDKSKGKKEKKVVKEKLPKILIVLGEKNEKLDQIILRSAKNMPGVAVTRFNSLNLVDLLKAEYLICEVKVIKDIEKLFLKK